MPLAATVLPSDVACAMELYVISCARTSTTPYQDRRAPSRVRSGTLTIAGAPATARCTCARICGSWPAILAYAYLLTGFTAFDRIGRFQRPSLARRVFGRQPVDDAVRQVREVLAGWGYSAREPHLTAMVCQMFLLNRSPLLEDLTSDVLLRMRSDPAMGEHRASTLYGVHLAVAALGHADSPPQLEHGPGLVAIEGTAPGWAEAAQHARRGTQGQHESLLLSRQPWAWLG